MKGLCACLLAVLFTSLAEYLVHRLMHTGVLRGQRHAEHHRDGWGQGFWPEFGDYLLPALPLLLLPWLLGAEIGAGWTLGCAGYAAFVAYAHQLQHESPAACRWMQVPVHYVHHRDQMWHHNFGLAVDWWDRVFGTYKVVPFGADPAEARRCGPLDIHWKRVSDGTGQPLAARPAHGSSAATIGR